MGAFTLHFGLSYQIKCLQRLSETAVWQIRLSEVRRQIVPDSRSMQLHWRLCRRSWSASDWRESYECQPSAVGGLLSFVGSRPIVDGDSQWIWLFFVYWSGFWHFRPIRRRLNFSALAFRLCFCDTLRFISRAWCLIVAALSSSKTSYAQHMRLYYSVAGATISVISSSPATCMPFVPSALQAFCGNFVAQLFQGKFWCEVLIL